jgi:hypothetical protein
MDRSSLPGVTPRRWRRFVRRQRSPLVRRWLRLDQAYREIGDLYRLRDEIGAVVSVTEDADGISMSGQYVDSTSPVDVRVAFLDAILVDLRERAEARARERVG